MDNNTIVVFLQIKEEKSLVKKLSSIIFFGLMVMLFISNTASANNEQYINSGSTYSGSLSSSEDVKWYTFTTTEDNSDMYIYLSDTTAPIRFNVYDSNKDLISNYNSTYFSTKKAGTYFIKVYPYSWGDKYSNGSYNIMATYASGAVQHDSTNHEPNDTRENAYFLNSGSKISSSLESIEDIDYYKITTTEDNGDIYIYLSNTSVPVRFDVYDSDKDLLSNYNSTYFSTKKAGTYYIKVYPYSWGDKHTSGTYDLIATYSTDTVKHDSITHEPNDTRENAYALGSGLPNNSLLMNNYDRDFYKITLDRPGTINIKLTDNKAPARFSVYDSNKDLLSNYNSSYSSEKKAGTYYIEVYSYNWGNKFSQGSYSLDVSYPTSFPDIQGHWAQGEIDYLVKQNLVGGHPNGTFAPDDNIRRSEAAAIIARELDLPLVKSRFDDVTSTHWASMYIGATAKDQIINGKGGNEFKPDDFLTRQEMAAILVRAYSLQGNAAIAFSDVNKNLWSYSYIEKMVANNITTGYGNNTFRPTNNITRAEFSVMVYRALTK